MSENLGPIVYGGGDHEVFLGKDYNNVRNYSEAVAADIDSEVKQIISTCYKKCEDIIKDNIDKLTCVAEYLIVNEKADGQTFEKLMKGEPCTEAQSEAIAEDVSDEIE